MLNVSGENSSPPLALQPSPVSLFLLSTHVELASLATLRPTLTLVSPRLLGRAALKHNSTRSMHNLKLILYHVYLLYCSCNSYCGFNGTRVTAKAT